MSNILRIARKEFAGFFSSPIAFIFLGAFRAVSLFVFFWVETFFARNIADVRPLFECVFDLVMRFGTSKSPKRTRSLRAMESEAKARSPR